jgi:uncharacterized protein with ParB-like and HNH nuclease domain
MASKKIKDFFNGRFYEIPGYQRGYAWEKQNITDLFDDIIESIESNSSHYIGTIVLSKSPTDEETFRVVDGQQRITTITLLINSLIKSLSSNDAPYFERFYLKEDNRHRLCPLSRDKGFFLDLLEQRIGHPKNKSQRFLRDAVEEINFKVDRIPDKMLFLKSIEKLEIMEFIEDSEGDAIRIFQTVNDRGKPLSNMEKAKSLLIYFSNRYLNKELDNVINNYFSDIFEIYDNFKHLGEELGINLISNKEFNEDNLMRYHFVSYSNENYDASASYVFQYLKRQLSAYRKEGQDNDYNKLKQFIISYIDSLKSFFYHCNTLIEKAASEPKYYKLFVILGLSATLYPLIVRLETIGLLERNLTGEQRSEFTFFDLLELIEVRVYKTRGTDPKADISRLVYDIENKTAEHIEGWLIWFNNRWMMKEEFQSNLNGIVFSNRALNHIFIDYCEHINKASYTLEELKALVLRTPNIEHILSQTPTFAPRALGFTNKEDFMDYEHCIGNLTLLERSFNSSIQNKSVLEKIHTYQKSHLIMTRKLGADIDFSKTFTKAELIERTKELVSYCVERWWCERTLTAVE